MLAEGCLCDLLLSARDGAGMAEGATISGDKESAMDEGRWSRGRKGLEGEGWDGGNARVASILPLGQDPGVGVHRACLKIGKKRRVSVRKWPPLPIPLLRF